MAYGDIHYVLGKILTSNVVRTEHAVWRWEAHCPCWDKWVEQQDIPNELKVALARIVEQDDNFRSKGHEIQQDWLDTVAELRRSEGKELDEDWDNIEGNQIGYPSPEDGYIIEVMTIIIAFYKERQTNPLLRIGNFRPVLLRKLSKE